MSSRWYPETLKHRILEIYKIRERITFIQGNGLDFIQQHIKDTNAVFFIDPPYTASSKNAGARLYKHNRIDHQRLFEVASQLQSPFLMTYDKAQEVVALAQQHGFQTFPVKMVTTHHTEVEELLICRDLNWITSTVNVRPEDHQ